MYISFVKVWMFSSSQEWVFRWKSVCELIYICMCILGFLLTVLCEQLESLNDLWPLWVLKSLLETSHWTSARKLECRREARPFLNQVLTPMSTRWIQSLDISSRAPKPHQSRINNENRNRLSAAWRLFRFSLYGHNDWRREVTLGDAPKQQSVWKSCASFTLKTKSQVYTQPFFMNNSTSNVQPFRFYSSRALHSMLWLVWLHKLSLIFWSTSDVSWDLHWCWCGVGQISGLRLRLTA